MSIYLASKSPRRQELLKLLDIDFQILTEDVNETLLPGRLPQEEVARISELKAYAVQAQPDDIIIAADTIVVLDGKIMGKPADRDDAGRMLRALSGRTHEAVTGLTLRRGETRICRTVTTKITFRTLSEREIEAYIATTEPLDKAGAYGIQGRASIFVKSIEGDYYNVMGLPLCTLTTLLRQLGVPVLGEPQEVAQ